MAATNGDVLLRSDLDLRKCFWAICPRWRLPYVSLLTGLVIAESTQTKRVLETSHPPVYYIPPADIRMELLKPTDRQSWCEWKGKARYFDVIAERKIPNAAWAYPSPTRAFESIRDHLAFYPHLMDACFVGEEQVQAQAGGFYGGWITSNIVGPFKGEPGTRGW